MRPGPARVSLLAPLLAPALAPLLVACGSASEPSPPSGVDALVIPSPSLDPVDFVTEIDNPWLPLVAGSEWVYRVSGEDGARTATVTVLDETREIQGVTATVVRDVVTGPDGEVIEETFDWFAQDDAGNVWHLGEDTAEYDGRRVSTEGSWEAGVGGGEAGLAMAASPRVGDGYRMEYLEGEAEDRATVLRLDVAATVPYGDLTGLLETEDSTPLEPDVVERKLYARGVGLVREETVRGGDEVVELVSFEPGS